MPRADSRRPPPSVRRGPVPAAVLASVMILAACGSGAPVAPPGSAGAGTGAGSSSPSITGTTTGRTTAIGPTAAARSAPATSRPDPSGHRRAEPTRPAASPVAPAGVRPAAALLAAGNPAGGAVVPASAGPVTASPTLLVGTGTAASCTSAAVIHAVAVGGVIGFRCGPLPVTIVLTATAKVRNTSPLVVLDGGGLVTLSGGGLRRILYQDTCDPAQVWTTSHCDDQATPQLVVQNLTFADGNATGQHEEGGGGGAILVRGGQFRVVHSRFVRNRCDPTGPDLGGAAIRVLDQWQGRPVTVVSSTFGGAPGQGGVCSNGGALSSIGVSWTVLDSVLSDNAAIGWGANPAAAGSPGGGSGGAIYNDGDTMTLRVAGSLLKDNTAREGGGAIFFVSDDRTGTMSIDSSQLLANPNSGFATAGYPGIFFLGRSAPAVTGSTLG